MKAMINLGKSAMVLVGGLLMIGVSSAVQAADTEVILEGNNVIRIENLEVINQLEEVTVYDVDFVYKSAIEVYGEDYQFDFAAEEDAVFARNAVREALNINNPTPTGAGPSGTDQFLIGQEFDDTSPVHVVASLGAEHFEGVWGICEIDCIAGVAGKEFDEDATYATFTESSGSDDPTPASPKVKGLVKKTTIADDGRWGGCMAQLDQELADYGLNCPGSWVTFSCSGVYAEKGEAYP